MTRQEWQSRILLLINLNNIYSRGFHDKNDFGNMKQQQQQGYSLEEVLCSWSEHQLLVDLQVQLWPLGLQFPPACCCPRIRTLKWQLVKQYDSIDMIWVDGVSWSLDYLGRENNGREEFWIGKSLKIASESQNGLVLLLGYASPHELHQKSIREWSQIQ